MLRDLMVATVAALTLLVTTLVAVPAAQAAVPSFTSDDFSGGDLSGAPWTAVDPVGNGDVAVSGAGTGDVQLQLALPAGTAYDAWGANQSLRVMQPAADVDLEVDARWSTVPSRKYETQGILVEQDADNWMRFDVHSTGSTLRLFAARTVDGSSQALHQSTVTAGDDVRLRVTRDGSSWTLAYATGTQSWTDVTTVSHALTVSAIGPFAGTSGTKPQWTSSVDWFFDTTAPVDPEDGQVAMLHPLTTEVVGQGSVTRSPDADAYVSGTQVQLTAEASEGWEFSGWSGDASGTDPATSVTVSGASTAVATFTELSDPPPPAEHAVQVDVVGDGTVASEPQSSTYPEGSVVTLTATPGAGSAFVGWGGDATGTDPVVELAVDGPLSVTATFETAEGPLGEEPPGEEPSAGIVSDDFRSGGLGSHWSVVDPVGDGSVSVTGLGTDDAQLSMSLPAGTDHDPWGSNRALRVMQPVADTDFEIEARWSTVPSQKYQMQGLLVEADEDDWLRFDVHSTGSTVRLFAARTTGGSSQSLHQSTISVSGDVRLRLTRVVDEWTLAYASGSDGWTVAATVTHALPVSAVGPFSGTSGMKPAWTASLDWFFDTAAPVVPEDGDVATGHPLVTDVVGEGTVSRSPQAQAYADGTSVELTAQPTAGWQFTGWSGDTSGTDRVTTVVVTGPVSVTATFEPVEVPPATGIVSDDFSSGVLGEQWTVVDPHNDGEVGFVGTGTTEARLAMSVPAGSAHDPWGSNGALRVMQPTADVDLEVAARFTSAPTAKYQAQGLLIEQGPDDWMRFDVHSTGSGVRAFAARTVGGSSTQVMARSIPESPETTLRVTREGDVWTLAVSLDGVTWDVIGATSHVMDVTAVGPFVANSGTKPAYTAEVDWFIDTATPVDPEDAVVADVHGLATDVVGEGTVTRSPSASTYVEGTVVELTAAPAPGWEFSQWGGDATGTSTTATVTMDAPRSVTATFTELPDNPPVIDVWYGGEQVFGAHGQSQQWVNVLGNASDPDGVTSMSYSLNGGAARALSLGPNLRRLYGDGDFNVQIPYAALQDGANSVLLAATDATGETATREVVVVKDITSPGGSRTVTWQEGDDPNDSAQVVDGKWSVGPDGLTVEEMGYDRTVAVGDMGWSDYEVTVPVTVRGLGPGAGTPQSGAPLVGMGLHWSGHSPSGSSEPYGGWWPTGAFAWYEWYGSGRYTLQGNEGQPLERASAAWDFGTTYVMKTRVEQEGEAYRYSYKWWPQGESEPSQWGVSVLEDAGPETGSVLLIAHHVDATFGAVVVTELP